MEYVGFDLRTVYKIRIYHGMALDGFKLHYRTGGSCSNGAPPVPKRDYLSKLFHGGSHEQQKQQLHGGEERTALVGKETPNYSDFELQPNEYITSFNFRNGGWIDAIQFATSTGRLSPMFGKASGGHLSTLEPPSQDFDIVGFYFYLNKWLRGVGIIYSSKN